MARWVVIGGTGYIGGALCRYLLAAGETVLSISRAASGPSGCEHLSIALNPNAELPDFFQPGDRVVYAAGLAGRSDCERNPHLARWLNSDCPVRLLCRADAAGAEAFVYLSSVKALLPPANRLANEECGTPAVDAYGASKWLAERQLLAEKVHCRVNLIRPAAVYGQYHSVVEAAATENSQSAGRAQSLRGLMRTCGRLLPRLPASGHRSFIALPDLLSAIQLVTVTASCDRQVYIAAEPRFYDIAAIASAAGGISTRGSQLMTRLLLAPLRPLRRLRLARQLLELEEGELYSAARLRGALPWRAEGRYSQFLRSNS
jgi:nucleoside-diphosphate-sugar epimerase